MKRQWGFDYIITKKTKVHAKADVGFIFIAYNLKRLMIIIGIEKLMLIISSSLSKYTLKTLKKTINALLNLRKQPKFNPLFFLNPQILLPTFNLKTENLLTF